jgi:hypothetical protein
MPNLSPQEWSAVPVKAMPGPWGPCQLNGCTIPEVREGGVYIASNIPGSPAGGYAGNHEEWRAFIQQVKDGAWDHTVVAVPVTA